MTVISEACCDHEIRYLRIVTYYKTTTQLLLYAPTLINSVYQVIGFMVYSMMTPQPRLYQLLQYALTLIKSNWVCGLIYDDATVQAIPAFAICPYTN